MQIKVKNIDGEAFVSIVNPDNGGAVVGEPTTVEPGCETTITLLRTGDAADIQVGDVVESPCEDVSDAEAAGDASGSGDAGAGDGAAENGGDGSTQGLTKGDAPSNG